MYMDWDYNCISYVQMDLKIYISFSRQVTNHEISYAFININTHVCYIRMQFFQ